MLSSKEDAEDVLQEVFAAAFNAMLADERPINVRPWLYRIARNRSLNHLRRTQAVGVDSMDVHLSEHGQTTADKVHRREEFRLLIADVQELPETQRTALLLREIDALSYEQIAEAMETTVPSVKSLLVRARVSLAEAAEARLLSCEEVREELGEVAEGLARTSAPVRRHLRTCERCATFRKQLRRDQQGAGRDLPGRAAAAAQEVAARPPGHQRGRRRRHRGRPRRRRRRRRGDAAMQAGIGTLATKTAAGLAAAAIVTAGAVEVKHAHKTRDKAAVDGRGTRRRPGSGAGRAARRLPVAAVPAAARAGDTYKPDHKADDKAGKADAEARRRPHRHGDPDRHAEHRAARQRHDRAPPARPPARPRTAAA